MPTNTPTARPLVIADRHVRLSILEMIQGNVTKALIEFITNSDDSYARLEARDQPVTGRIQVDVRAGEGGFIRITDDAEGFDGKGLDDRFGTLGLDMSGHESGVDVRGFFGDGLKEGVLGLKRGGILKTIRDGKFAQAELMWEGNKPVYRLRQPPTPVTPAQRRELGLQGNGTQLTVLLDTDVSIPQHARLLTQLSRHFALRDILQNPARKLILRRLNPREKVVSQDDAVYREPTADEQFGTKTISGTVPEYGVPFTITLKRSTEPLSGQEDGQLRAGGLLIRSRRAILEITFGPLDNRPGTEHLFGYLDCPHLYERLHGEDVVVNKNRSGLNRQNDFVRALLTEAAQLLAPFVQEEVARAQSADAQPLDPKSRRKLDDLKNELNRIARLELEEQGDEEGDAEGTAALRFSRKGYTLIVGEPKTVRAIVEAARIQVGDVLTLEVVGGGLSLESSTHELSPQDQVDGYISCDTQLVGMSELSAGLIDARVGDLKASATIQVKRRVDNVPPPFAFEHDAYRIPVSEWKELTLRIHVPSVSGLPAEVTYRVDQGTVEVRPDADVANPLMANGEWLTLRVKVRGDQIGAEDTLEARMGSWVGTARLKVVSSEKEPPSRRGGLIRDIRYDPREDPVQRTLFQDGVITLYVNHASIRRYLFKTDDRDKPAGRALVADLAMHAFCRYIGEKTYKDDPFVNDPEGAIHTVFNIYEKMLKKYGERIHSIMNPA